MRFTLLKSSTTTENSQSLSEMASTLEVMPMVVRNGTAADDELFGTDNNDTLSGFDGNDVLFGLDGQDVLLGGNGQDFLDGGAGGDRLEGNNGSDELLGGDGNDTLLGGADGDYLDGEGGIDQLIGGTGNDQYVIDSLSDVIVEAANEGEDLVYLKVAGDFSFTLDEHLEGLSIDTNGNINATGNASNNLILGGGGNNTLQGLGGDDFIRGDLGNDTINGGTGNDIIMGEFGNDQLAGGAGNDRFVIDNPVFSGADQITDFNTTDDVVALFIPFSSEEAGFGDGNLTVDAFITAEQFRVGAVAADASDRLIYNPANGELWFDADGTGTTAAFRVATLTPGLNLNHNNIFAFQDYDKLRTLTPGNSPGPNQPTEGDDNLQGTDNDDTLAGLGGNDAIRGLLGNDSLSGDAGNDTLQGNTGNDRLLGGTGRDRLLGQEGNDTLLGGSGSDTLYGNIGRDRLLGELGNDTLLGGSGSDTLQSGGGNDLVVGELGNDVITTGAGRDRIMIRPGQGFDRVTDFADGFDRIVLSGLSFGQLTIEQRNSNVLISQGNERLLLLQNVDVSRITAADFT